MRSRTFSWGHEGWCRVGDGWMVVMFEFFCSALITCTCLRQERKSMWKRSRYRVLLV